MRLNLNEDIAEQVAVLNEKTWTALQAQTCMNVANAKLYAFEEEAAAASPQSLCAMCESTSRRHLIVFRIAPTIAITK